MVFKEIKRNNYGGDYFQNKTHFQILEGIARLEKKYSNKGEFEECAGFLLTLSPKDFFKNAPLNKSTVPIIESCLNVIKTVSLERDNKFYQEWVNVLESHLLTVNSEQLRNEKKQLKI